MLRGTWKFNDGQGVLNVTMKPDGTYFSTREVLGASTFHQVFSATPVSNGTWSVTQGQLKISCRFFDLFRPSEPYHSSGGALRFPTDLIYVDYLGRMGRAVKAQ